MHTQAHALLSYIAIKTSTSKEKWALVLGSILPDTSIVFMYITYKFFYGLSDQKIWSEIYFTDHFFQSLKNTLHSFPVLITLLLLAWIFQKRPMKVFALSAFLHALLDFPLHVDDGHMHFYPLSNWIYQSPVSYWDPKHYGLYFFTLELLFFASVTFYIWKSLSKKGKSLTALGGLMYLPSLLYYFSLWR